MLNRRLLFPFPLLRSFVTLQDIEIVKEKKRKWKRKRLEFFIIPSNGCLSDAKKIKNFVTLINQRMEHINNWEIFLLNSFKPFISFFRSYFLSFLSSFLSFFLSFFLTFFYTNPKRKLFLFNEIYDRRKAYLDVKD